MRTCGYILREPCVEVAVETISVQRMFASPYAKHLKGDMIMKKIAVITGASSGMGREFVYAIDKESKLDELWVIARREERLL